ncbi:MAG: 50S ribosomal protein L29 [Planctomycetota bacterium]|nr:MAG: 50S ribosomal protein L29 [Planctomycetota bacterium]
MKAKDLRNMDLQELRENWENLEEKLFQLRFQSVTEEIQNPAAIREMRKDIARILTVIREKEIEEGIRKPKAKKTKKKTKKARKK